MLIKFHLLLLLWNALENVDKNIHKIFSSLHDQRYVHIYIYIYIYDGNTYKRLPVESISWFLLTMLMIKFFGKAWMKWNNFNKILTHLIKLVLKLNYDTFFFFQHTCVILTCLCEKVYSLISNVPLLFFVPFCSVPKIYIIYIFSMSYFSVFFLFILSYVELGRTLTSTFSFFLLLFWWINWENFMVI